MLDTAHLADVMTAVRERIRSLDGLFDNLLVEIGNPAQFHPRSGTDPPLVTLFVYRIEPDHAALLATPNTAAAMRLHVLVTVYCSAGENEFESPGTYELRILSHIVRLFHEQPYLGPVRIREAVPVGPIASLVSSDIMIEARQMAPDMEEINHIWTTQGAETPFRPSLVYRFAFGIVTPSRPSDEGPPVLRAELRDPADTDPTSPGPIPQLSEIPAEPEPELGVLSVNLGTPSAPVLVPGTSFVAGSGAPSLELVAVTEAEESLDLVLERFDQSTGLWSDESDSLDVSSITSLARPTLQDGGLVTAETVGFPDPGVPAVFRLGARRGADPEGLRMSPVFVTAEEVGA